MRYHVIVATACVVLGGSLVARKAEADCWFGSCGASYCDIQCSSSREYVLFGAITSSPSGTGHGVCWFTFSGTWGQGGTCQGCIVENEDTADWRIKLGGGNDLIRLASRSGETSSCGGNNWTIDGDISSGDTFMYWGEDDDDRLFLCSSDNLATTPTSTLCVVGGRADGRAGADVVYGSSYADTLWGDGGIDSMRGWGGADYLYGGADDDSLLGGTHCDRLHGDAHGVNGDYCDCSETSSSTNEGYAYDCESTDGKCLGCLLGPEPGGSQPGAAVSEPSASTCDAGTDPDAGAGR